MTSDEDFVAAVIELNDAMLNSISAKSNISHLFSRHFERKMKMLIRKVNYSRRYSALRTVASISIVIFLSFMMLLAISPTARATVVNWIKEHCAPYIEYIIPQSHGDGTTNYSITSLPEEYIELSRTDTGNSCIVVYSNLEGKQIHLIYSSDPAAGNLFIVEEGHSLIEVTVSGFIADLYFPDNPEDNLSIVWYDSIEETLFYISAQVSQAELVNFAESVK